MTPTTINSAAPGATTVAAAVSRGTPVVSNLANTALENQTLDIASLEDRCQFPMRGLPKDIIKCIFMECLSSGDIKGFMALGRTNTHSYVTMRTLLNEVALTKLCPNLRILDARTFKFQADLETVDKYKALQTYYRLEAFVEGREGLTVIFNQGGLTLKDMKDNKCGVTVNIAWDQISEELDAVPEENAGPEMISNAPITETRNKSDAMQETRVKDEVGFDGKPTLIQYLALLIATQKELKICLYGEKLQIYGRISTKVAGYPLVVGGSAPGRLFLCHYGLGYERHGAGGRRKL